MEIATSESKHRRHDGGCSIDRLVIYEGCINCRSNLSSNKMWGWLWLNFTRKLPIQLFKMITFRACFRQVSARKPSILTGVSCFSSFLLGRCQYSRLSLNYDTTVSFQIPSNSLFAIHLFYAILHGVMTITTLYLISEHLNQSLINVREVLFFV
jgi:hypothetical protein